MTQKRRGGAVTGAKLALVICRGIAEDAERAFFGGWRHWLVLVAAGDGCRNDGELMQKWASGRVLRGLWRGISCGWSRCGGLAFGAAGRRLGVGCMGPGRWTCGRGCCRWARVGGDGREHEKIPPRGGVWGCGRYALWRVQWSMIRRRSASGMRGSWYKSSFGPRR